MAKDRGPAPLVLKPLPVFKHAKRPDQLLEAAALGNAALAAIIHLAPSFLRFASSIALSSS
jgi:hypothetical protein